MPPEAMDLIQAHAELERELEGLISVLETSGLPASSIESGLARVAERFTQVRAHAGELERLDANGRDAVKRSAARSARLHGVMIGQVTCEFDALRQELGHARGRREQLDRLGELRAGATSGGSCDVTG